MELTVSARRSECTGKGKTNLEAASGRDGG